MPTPASPVVYVTDLSNPADLFDLAYLIRSPDHELRAVCVTGRAGEVASVLAPLGGSGVSVHEGADGPLAALRAAPDPVNLVVVGGYGAAAGALAADRALFQERVARLFLVGGHVNDYARVGRDDERLPYDPRLRERNPERFSPTGDSRVGPGRRAWGTLLTSGQGVIWLPGDICLWRYYASGLLRDGGDSAGYLTDQAGEGGTVLLSALPAFLLAVHPDPFVWLRLFRVVTARAAVGETGELTHFATGSAADPPNLHALVAIDSQALSKRLTAGLRDNAMSTPAT